MRIPGRGVRHGVGFGGSETHADAQPTEVVCMVTVTMRQLLEAGVHFGHQTKRWNPKMKPYIFGERNGIYIIDLQKTMRLFKGACEFIFNACSDGKEVLFVGTKKQAQVVIQEEALRSKMYYVTHRWLGGMLTNFATIKKSVARWETLETMKANDGYLDLSKKEAQRLEKERIKLERNLEGIRKMTDLPGVLVVVDPKMEHIAVQEARKLNIPVIAIIDTNCDPNEIDYPIPGNDDAIRSIQLIISQIAQSAINGHDVFRKTIGTRGVVETEKPDVDFGKDGEEAPVRRSRPTPQRKQEKQIEKLDSESVPVEEE